jgi:hypothetical protein
MTTRTLLAAAALVAAAASAPLTLAHAQGPARTLTLHVTGTQVSAVDLPPLHRTRRSPETAGDVVVARSRVTGAATGARYLRCGVVKPGRGYARALVSCDVTYVLADGTITAAGVVRLAGPEPAVAAVTGGTGAYAGARGTLTAAPDGTDTLALS